MCRSGNSFVQALQLASYLNDFNDLVQLVHQWIMALLVLIVLSPVKSLAFFVSALPSRL